MTEESNLIDDAVDDLLPGGKFFTKYTPAVLERGYRLFVGPSLFLYGHNRAGKTSLIKYLLTSTPIDPKGITERTQTEITNRALGFKLHGRDDVSVHIKSMRDRPGQVDGSSHAIRFCQELPHTALIMLDSKFPYEGKSVNSIEGYLRDFWDEVRLRKRVVPPKVKRVWIIANKADLLTEGKQASLLKKIEKDVAKHTKGLIHPARVKVRGCSLIAGERWNTMRDKMVRDIFSDIVFSR
ncbi:MAG: hypothetical protein ABJL72_15635 [Roseobacter sp.]